MTSEPPKNLPVVNPATLAPYDVYVIVDGSDIHFTASSETNYTGADFLRALYRRAYTPDTMRVSTTGSIITLSTTATHAPTMHALAELLSYTLSIPAIRLAGDSKALFSVMPWKATAYYMPSTGNKNGASFFKIAPLNPWGVNDETFKYLRHLGGWKSADDNTWRVPMNKLFKFIQSNTPGDRGIAITRSLANILVEPIGEPFDGEVLSLKDTPISELHFAKYDTRPQNSKREKGKTLAESLAGFGYKSIFDVLYNMPRRYLDLSNPVSSLHGLDAGETAYIVGRVSSWHPMKGNKGAWCTIKTSERSLKTAFWGPYQWREKKYPVGTEVIVGGKVTFYNGLTLTADFIDTLDVSSTDNPYVPIYAQSPSRGIMTNIISNLVREALTRLTVEGNPSIKQNAYWAEEALPEGILTLQEALTCLHFPTKPEDVEKAVESLAWYELVLMQVLIKDSQVAGKDAKGVQNKGDSTDYVKKVIDSLPYTLTGDQQTAYKTIKKRMSGRKPMDALLSADVGAGKTIVQILAALTAIDSGRQAVIVAPTEILARQIYSAAQTALKDVDLEPTYMSGSMKAAERSATTKSIKEGDAKLIIGTHTLLNATEFNDLGFVCFDEQQKFGVEQRSRLLGTRKDNATPDFLLATATPIPRTIAQIEYGEVDFIQMKEKPAGRKPVETEWVEAKYDHLLNHPKHTVWHDLHKEIKAGHQAFIVAPLVEENSDLEAPSVKELAKDLTHVLTEARIGVLHGKMKAKEQEEAMRAFRDGETDVLVASTIVEVGVDIPNATRIVIMGAERLGASSLHQLRGRVGRNDLHAKCWLVSPAETPSAQARMEALVAHDDGFAIAEADTMTRGEGDVLTSNQHGITRNRFLRLSKHRHIISSAISHAESIISDPEYNDVALQDARKFFDDMQ